jgi:hypothetical protein
MVQTKKIEILVHFGGSRNGWCWYIGYILWLFGIFFHVLVWCTKAKLATLSHTIERDKAFCCAGVRETQITDTNHFRFWGRGGWQVHSMAELRSAKSSVMRSGSFVSSLPETQSDLWKFPLKLASAGLSSQATTWTKTFREKKKFLFDSIV